MMAFKPCYLARAISEVAVLKKRSFISILLTLGVITISIGYAQYRYDPFAPYRDFVKKPLLIKPTPLKYFANEERLIREKLKLDLVPKERSILSGLHWVIGLADDEKKFKVLFPDFLLLIDSLSHGHGRVHQEEVAKAISKRALSMSLDKLSKLFENEPQSGWRFLGLLPVLSQYPELLKGYLSFYQKQWPDLHKDQAPSVKEFQEAVDKKRYQDLFDALVITSFPHYYRMKVKDSSALLPPDMFPGYLKAFESMVYKDHPIEDQDFRTLGYLVTHVPMVLTNYGEYKLPKGVNSEKAKAYMESSLKKAHQLGDFDLFAEYILCLKMFGPDDSPHIKDLEKFIFKLQRPDGSWGSKRDFATSPYTAIHPTGAALMALNQVDQRSY